MSMVNEFLQNLKTTEAFQHVYKTDAPILVMRGLRVVGLIYGKTGDVYKTNKWNDVSTVNKNPSGNISEGEALITKLQW